MTGYPEAGRGLMLSVMASTLFALMSVYAKLLAPLTGIDIFAWRVLWTAPGALALIALRGRWPALVDLLRRSVRDWRLLIALPVSAALLGVQLWLFLWAPLHGRMLEVSLGYFLLPLTMVLVGRFYYHERLDPLQWAAVACAALGVAHEVWRRARSRGRRSSSRSAIRRISCCAGGSTPIRSPRSRSRSCCCPVAFAMVATSTTQVADHPVLWAALLPGLGVLSTLALASYLKASRMLPMALFGILGYVGPCCSSRCRCCCSARR